MTDSELFSAYKEKCKINNNYYCLLNVFDKNGFCHSPLRSLDERGIKAGCCGRFGLCWFYKKMDYSPGEFLQCFKMLYGHYNDKFIEIFEGIDKLLKSIGGGS